MAPVVKRRQSLGTEMIRTLDIDFLASDGLILHQVCAKPYGPLMASIARAEIIVRNIYKAFHRTNILKASLYVFLSS